MRRQSSSTCDNSGLGRESSRAERLPKIACMRRMLNDRQLSAELEVDGGINPENAGDIIRAGADVLVAGNSVFKTGEGIGGALKRLRQATA